EDFHKAGVVEHQVEADRCARRGRETVAAAAAAHPDRPAAHADVPVELNLTADDVGLPEVVHVERAAVVAVAGTGSVVETPVVDAVAPEAETEVERIGGRDPKLGG